MNIMLFSDIPPSTNYSSGIVLDKLCGFLLDAGHKVCCFICMNPELKPNIPEDKQNTIKIKIVEKPNENWGGGKYAWMMNRENAEKVLPKITNQAAEFAKENSVQKLWIVEQGQSIILQVRPLAKATGLPYVIQTWDSPEWWMMANNYAEETKAEVMAEYGKALEEADCFIAASWAMERKFKEKYHCKRSKAVVLGFPEGGYSRPREKKKDEFVIALAGQIYAIEEFRSLIFALNTLGWKHNGKTIYVDIFAPYLPDMEFPFQVPGNVRIRGWRPQYELLNDLQDADLLYCGYWFDEVFRVVSETSFPSKLSTYLSAHRPVVVHAPEYASPSIFITQNQAGYVWTTRHSEALAEEIKKIMDDPQRERVVAKGDVAFKKYLTTDCMRRDFFEALELPFVRPQKQAEPLRVLHVNNVDMIGNRFNGYDMMLACASRKDIEIRQVVTQRMSNEENVLDLLPNDSLRQMYHYCTEYENAYSMRGIIQPFGRLIKQKRAYREADVVHYHLIHNGVMSLLDLSNMVREKTSVLTVHDPWLVTGHCIYPLGCSKWQTGCRNCENLQRPFAMKEDNVHLMWRIRQRLFENMDINLIVASKWMENFVKRSPITANIKHIYRIPFGIDLSLFTERSNSKELRVKYGIDVNSFVVMFRQDSSPFKGMSYIIEALKQIADAKSITVLTVGSKGLINELHGKVGKIVEFEWLTDSKLIAELYSLCDVFLMPSTAEAFGLMAIETMASGKPIIVMDGTSLPEVVKSPEIGISVPQGDVEALAAQITYLKDNPDEARHRGKLGRKLAEEEYQFKDYVERHVALYRELIAQRASEYK